MLYFNLIYSNVILIIYLNSCFVLVAYLLFLIICYNCQISMIFLVTSFRLIPYIFPKLRFNISLAIIVYIVYFFRKYSVNSNFYEGSKLYLYIVQFLLQEECIILYIKILKYEIKFVNMYEIRYQLISYHVLRYLEDMIGYYLKHDKCIQIFTGTHLVNSDITQRQHKPDKIIPYYFREIFGSINSEVNITITDKFSIQFS